MVWEPCKKNKMKKVIAIIGTRPQYIKHASFSMAAKRFNAFELITIDTGQHYDQNMSQQFITEFSITDIKYNLGIISKNHGEQTGKMLIEIEKILLDERPDYVVVYGDTNSTLSGALAAVKLKIPIIHVEAGMRNKNIDIPEEVNRVLTDHISSFLVTSSQQAYSNLIKEGIDSGKILPLGDITIELLHKIKDAYPAVNKNSFYYCTIHRPVNTNEKERLLKIFNALNNLNKKVKFAIHPRTKNNAIDWDIDLKTFENIELINPVSFSESIKLIIDSSAIITDSGGMQKDAYILKKKCISILPFTPWVETLTGKWNSLVFDNLDQLQDNIEIEPSEDDYNEGVFGSMNVADQIIESILLNEV
jgi:UDP-GlcNAc3NAcA epimerase